MELKEAIASRRSIRGFKKDPVAKEILAEIIQTSLRAPSAMNIQPWDITVVAGAPLEELRKGNMELLRSGRMPESDFGSSKPYEGIYKERQRDLGFALYGLMEIGRDDKEKRNEWTMHGFRAFDAPAVIILSMDESLGIRMAASDIGGLAQTICLAALDYGLGTCINGQGIMFPESVRKATGIPASKKMHICIAIGYPDWDHPANKLISARASLAETTRWIGF
jgi:nitroreductase